MTAVVALIAWVEFRAGSFAAEPLYFDVASLFSAVIGSVSFWGSLVAFGKLRDIVPGRPIGLGRAQSALNGLLLVAAIVLCVLIVLGGRPSCSSSGCWCSRRCWA